MRVLFISYELPPIGGGGGRAALQVARRLAGRGHSVAILSSLFAGLPEREQSGGVAIHRLRVRRKRPDQCTPVELLSFMLRSIPAARRLADEMKPTVVCAFFGIPGGPAAWRLRRRRGIPYVLSLRGSDVPRPELASHQRLHALTRPLLRRMYRDAAGLIAVSDSLRRAALAVLPEARIEVIPNGVDTERFKPPVERSGPADRAELLFVGRLQEFKGVQDAIAALPALERAFGRPARLTVIGDGPSRPALEAQAMALRAAGLNSEVRFLGWLDPAALPAAYQSASLLLLPSYVEGHSNVILEALASGLPCVASDVPGIRETITDGREGILVPPRTPEALTRAAARVLADAEIWRTMSRNARARAEEFSWDKIAAEYEAVLLSAEHGATPCAT
ncbi:MAG: glycosyltransferase family 4 protein [Candidatus Brocadiia bacterium]